MGIVFQQAVTSDVKYSFNNDPSYTVFDVHNDNPFNLGISFGRDTGIQGADYYASPHSILYGIMAPGSNRYTIGGVKFAGTIYLYTQTPLGGGTTNLGSAPALSITVIGYPGGANPGGSTSLNRMQNIGNPVNTVGGVASSIQNDGNALSTPVLEATVSGQVNPTVKLSNDGQLVLGNGNIGGTVAVHLYEALNSGVIRPVLDINDSTLATEVISGTEVDTVINNAIITKVTNAGLELLTGSLNVDAVTSVAGTSAGTMKIAFPLWGAAIKMMIVTLAGYNGTVKTITLPSTLSRGFIFVGDLGGGTPDLQAMVSGGNVSTTAITAFGSSANGTLVGGVAHMFQGAIHNIVSTIDSFQITPGGVSNGTIILIGL